MASSSSSSSPPSSDWSDLSMRSIVLGDKSSSDEAADRKARVERKRKLKKIAKMQAKVKKLEAKAAKDAERKKKKRAEKVRAETKAEPAKQKPVTEACSGILPGLMTPAQKKLAFDNVEEVFDKASKEISAAVAKSMEDQGYEPPTEAAEARAHPGRVPLELASESELEILVRPETLRCGDWNTMIGEFPSTLGDLIGSDPQQQQMLLLKKIYTAVDVINSKLDRVTNIQHLHTVSLINVVKTSNVLRMLCLADGMEKNQVYEKLQSSLRTVALASDSDLKELPFKNLATLEDFFGDRNRIQKLGYFALWYTEYSKSFAKDLTNTLLSANLQHACFWSIGIQQRKGYVYSKWKHALGSGRVRIRRFRSLPTDTSYLPIYVQMFFIRVAKAAFEYAHVNTTEHFDEPAFCREMKMLLYNTSRNEKKREASAKAAESTPAPASGSAPRSPPIDHDSDTTVVDKSPRKRPQIVLERYQGIKRIRAATPEPTVKEESVKPNIKRGKAVGKGQGSALQQLEDLVDTGAGRDVVVSALHGFIKDTVPGRRRAIKKAVEEATELLLKISNFSDEDDWQFEVSKYKDCLGKL